MKQKTIIQVWGRVNVGKSETIKIVHEELIKAYINPAHTYTIPIGGIDIHPTLICSGYKVGIESMGDYLYAYGLNERLDNYMVRDKCDLLICASRVYNDVSRHIDQLATTNGYRIVKVTNYQGSNAHFSQDQLNQLAARHIVSLASQIIAGVI